MKLRLPTLAAIATILVFASVTTADARWGDGKWGEGKRGRKFDERQMKERVEMMKMWKLTQILDLDQETAAKVFPLMHEFDVKQYELRRQCSDTIKQIRDSLDSDVVDSAALGSLIDRFKKSEREKVELRIERLDALSKVLSDEQIAEMIALVPKFEQRMRGMFEKAGAGRQDRRDRMWGNRGGPPDFAPGPSVE